MGKGKYLENKFVFFVIWIAYDIRNSTLVLSPKVAARKEHCLRSVTNWALFPCVPQQPLDWDSPVTAHYLRNTIQSPHNRCKALRELAAAMYATLRPTTLPFII